MAPERAQSLRGLSLCCELDPEDELVLVSSPGKRKRGLRSKSSIPSDLEGSGCREHIDGSGGSGDWSEGLGVGKSMVVVKVGKKCQATFTDHVT